MKDEQEHGPGTPEPGTVTLQPEADALTRIVHVYAECEREPEAGG
jgi:hypothetical protein